MSLYKDASLVMIPSAYKDGRLYSIRPVEELGSELVTNGTFDTDSDWIKNNGATISGGKANIVGDGSSFVNIAQNSVFTSGKEYKVTLDVTINSGLGLKFQDGASNENIGFATTSGHYVFYFTASANTTLVIGRRTGGTAFDSSVDNVSVKEVITNGDFTFSRGSNLGATRVDVNGLIEKGRENLLLQSNQFDTTWSLTTGITITSGQADKDGGTNAWLLKRVDGSSRFLKQTISQTGVQSFSLYIKAEATEWVYLFLGGTTSWAYFDLGSGSVGLTNSLIDSSIEAAGNGFYRCTITANASTSEVRVYPAQGNGAVSGDSDNGVYIQDAQLEAGLVATDYIETTSSTAFAGILEDMPRLDYSGGASCPALLLEPQRSNLFDYSEYASGNSLVGNPTITENYAVSPDGTKNAFQVDSASGGSFKRIRKILSVSANSTYTCSYFIKKATSAVTTFSGIGMVWQNGTQKVNYIIVDEYNGTMYIAQDQTGNTSTQVDDYGTYWRFSVSATDTGSNNVFESAFYGCLSTNGTSVGLGAKTWVGYGFQVEAGSYPTSYIPTYGASVTRSADSCANTSATDIINQDEGTLFVDFVFDGKRDNIDYYHMAIIDSYAQNEIRLGGYNLALYGRIYSGGTLTFAENYTTNATIGQRYKVIIKYGSEGVKTFANGQLKDSGTPTLPTGTMDEIRITRSGVGTHSSINQSVYFPTALTDSECIALTTI